ncbi:MAG: hypothetical protein AABW50_00850 [Nanoarchaeota archaeon]
MENSQEIQFTEQNQSNLLLQKQAFQLGSFETQTAVKEMDSSGDEVFRIVGNLMIKSCKKK